MSRTISDLNKRVEDVVANISGILRPHMDIRRYAEGMLEEADDDEEHFEVRGSHTRTGNPHTFLI